MNSRSPLFDLPLTTAQCQEIFDLRVQIIHGGDFAAIEPAWRAFLERSKLTDAQVQRLERYLMANADRDTEEKQLRTAIVLLHSRQHYYRKPGRKAKWIKTTVKQRQAQTSEQLVLAQIFLDMLTGGPAIAAFSAAAAPMMMAAAPMQVTAQTASEKSSTDHDTSVTISDNIK